MSEQMSFAGAKFLRLDDASETVTYIGYGLIGTADSAAAWKIIRMTTTGTETVIEYADGNNNFDNVWSDRASLSYS
jgi:hypothetical protein